MITLYFIVSLFFTVNLTWDFYDDHKRLLSVYGLKGVIVAVLMFFILWPVWLLRAIWNTIFE
jgi:hypothetical protein